MNPQRQQPTQSRAQQQVTQEQIQKHREYVKQQQKLRLMASAAQKPHQVSADAFIDNLLGKKDTFKPMTYSSPASFTSGNIDSRPPNISKSPQGDPHSGQTDIPAEWLSRSSPNFPLMYHRIWTLVALPDGMVDTGKIFPLLLTSGLHTDVLGFIWSLVNRVVPGKLTEHELYAVLALVALAQKGYSFNSVDVLSLVPQPPLPNLNIPVEPQYPSKMTREDLNLQAQLPEPMTSIMSPSHQPIKSPSNGPSIPQSVPQMLAAQSSIPATFHLQPTTEQSDFDDFADFQSAATFTPTTSFSLDTNAITNAPSSSQLMDLRNLEPSPSELCREPSFDAIESSTTDLSVLPEPVFVQKIPTISLISGGRSIGSRLANHSLGAPKTSKTRHHKHHRSTLPTSTSVEDDFSDFQQATADSFMKCAIQPPPTHTFLLKESAIRSETPGNISVASRASAQAKSKSSDIVEDEKYTEKSPEKQPSTLKGDSELMGVEDRYGALRALSFVNENPTADSGNMGDFFSTGPMPNDSFAAIASRSVATPSNTDVSMAATSTEIPCAVEFEVDDWGTFATAPPSIPPSVAVSPQTKGYQDDQLVGDWGKESSIMDSLSLELTDLNFDYNPVQSELRNVSGKEFQTETISRSTTNVLESLTIPSSLNSALDADILSRGETEDDDFGEFVGPDTWSKNSTMDPELNSWTQQGTKELDDQSFSNLWLEETKTMDDQQWPDDGKYGSEKLSKDGVLENNLVSTLWLEESKALDNQSVRSLELPGMDQSWNAIGEWRKCLQTCLTILQFAADTFEAVLDPKVMQEILGSNVGKDYLKGLVEVWAIRERLATSYRQSGFEHKLDALLNSTESTWALLQPYFSQAQINPETELELEGQDTCSVCLGSGASLEFEGCTYHSSCANLWLHHVDTVLPALQQPFT